MRLLILCHVVVTMLAFCTFQCDSCTHNFHLAFYVLIFSCMTACEAVVKASRLKLSLLKIGIKKRPILPFARLVYHTESIKSRINSAAEWNPRLKLLIYLSLFPMWYSTFIPRMIVLDAISTKLNPNAIATQVAKSVIVCSRSICIFPGVWQLNIRKSTRRSHKTCIFCVNFFAFIYSTLCYFMI